MNIYDFDETIYDSDSTKDFYFYCLKKYPKILLSVPIMAWTFFLYILGVKTKTQFKEKMYRFLTYVPDIDSALNDFWNVNEHKVKSWYKDRQKDDDIIISASPEFLLKLICERLGIKNLMASKVDKHTGLYDGENCWGEEKVKRLYEKFPNAKCEEFYSDSLSDTPLAELADKAMIIRGNELIEWNEYKPSKLKMFLSREFLSFLIVGGINTVSNVIFSTIYSLFIPNTTLAFFPGYITSNVVSYLLNSKLTFKEIDMKNEYYIFSYLKKVKDYAIKIADEKAWYAPILNNFGKWSYDLVDNDLYDGMGGPALIAHYYGKDEELQENIISIMESRCNDEMVDFYIKQKNVGLAASFGIFHVVSFMKKEYINCPRIAKIIEFFHSVLERMIDKEMECDYINGTLSVVATLLRLYEKNGEIKNKQLAISYLEKTIENKESFDGYGMAHGLMGLTLMLYKVWKVTGIK